VFHPRLKPLRLVVALAVGALLTAALADFRGLIPIQVGRWLASIQFVPSLVALATGATLSLACVVIVIATLLAGRMYCSAVCPLGILQDVIARLAAWAWRKHPAFLPYAPPLTWLRQVILWATVAGVAAGGGGLVLSLVDPYSNFGRLAADLFRPVVTLANNAAVGLGNTLGVGTLYRVEPPWAGAGALHLPVLFLALLVVLVVLRGRLYCNTLCPVGTLLGWLAQRAAFRLAIDRSVCDKCGDCLRACKAQCIDLRQRTIDFSRCVTCYNCLGACPERGIGYHFLWARKSGGRPVPAISDSASAPAPDPQRRAFLTDTALAVVATLGAPAVFAARLPAPPATRGRETAGNADDTESSRAICPPGAVSVDRFLARCTACHLCLSVCPTQVLQPAFLEYGFAGLMKPRLDFTKSPCTYTCRACAEVCPDGAIDRLALAEKQLIRIGEAHLDVDRCIVKTKGTDCAACSEQCPTQAVTTVPFGTNLRLPQLNRDYCIGCGGCEYACPVQPQKAIVVTGYRRHGWARKAADQKAATPVPAGGFPF
jgi:ferredoxin